MKKLFTLLTLALLAIPIAWGNEVTFTAGTDTGDKSVSKDGITVSMTDGTMSRTDNYRCYSGGTMTISSTVGNITKIVLTCTASGTDSNGPSKFRLQNSTGTYSYSGKVGTWTVGAAPTSSVSFYASAQVRMTSIVVTYTPPTVAAPTFSVQDGTYTSAQDVSISCTTSGAEIRYTLNNTEPTATSTLYEGTPIHISETTTLRAKAFLNGASSLETTATYTINPGSSNGVMTFTPSSSSLGSLNNPPVNGVTYSMSGFSGFTSGQGAQRTNNASPATITFSNLPSNYKVTKIEVEYCTNASGGYGTISATLNGNALGNSFNVTKPSSGGNTLKTATLYNNATGTAFSGYLVISTLAEENSIYIHKISVTYEKIPEKAYNVTVTQTTGGNINATPSGNKVVNSGDPIVVEALAADGYQLSAWNNSGISETNASLGTTNPVTVHATGNVSITATFGKVDYSLTRSSNSLSMGDVKITDNEGNELSTQPTTAQMGDVVYFKLTTQYGYVPATNPVTVTNTTTSTTITPSYDSTKGLYSFTMPAGNVSIVAEFIAYHGTLRLAGHFNGNSNWRSGNEGPAFTYNGSNDTYTIDAYFTGIDEGGANDHFFLTLDGVSKYPKADNGVYYIYDLNGGSMTFELSGDNTKKFGCAPGVYSIEINGALTSMKFTKKTPTISFSPAGGEVEQGATVTATSSLAALIADVKSEYDADAMGSVSVGVNTDNGDTWNTEVILKTIGNNQPVYGKAYIGNLTVLGSASYNVVKANNSNKYQLVTNVNSMESSKKYLIVSKGNYTASNHDYSYEVAAADVNNSILSAADVEIVNNIITLSDESSVVPYVMTLSNGKWTFKNSNTNSYLTFTDPSSGGGSVGTDNDSGTAFTLSSINSTNGSAVLALSNSTLQFNPNSGNYRFTTYKSPQKSIMLFKQMKAGDYTITYANATGGSASGVADADEDNEITVTLTAESGYAPSGITVNPTVDVTDNGNGTYTFTMPASNVTVTPSFAPAYAITYVADPATGGTVTGVASAVYNARVEVTVDPSDDYQLNGTPTYTYNGTTQQLAGAGTTESPYYFNMPGYATTVTANFTKIPHSISVTSAHGEVTGIPQTATSGTEVTFTVTPNAGYTVSNVTGTFNNGNSSLYITNNGNGTYTFSMPAFDVAINVMYFAPDEYELLTDLSDINAEDTYLIVGGPASDTSVKSRVMGKSASNDIMGTVILGSDNYNNGIITSSEGMAIVNFLVGTGDDAGKYALHTSEGYINTSSVRATSPYYMTITLDNSSSRATIGSYFSYNSSSPRWKYYTAHQGANYIYKLANKNKVKRPSVTGTAGEYLGLYNFIGKDIVTLTSNTEGATMQYSLDEGNTWLNYSEPFEINTDAAGNKVKVMARATKTGMDASDDVIAEFTCIKPTAPTFGNNEPGAHVNPVFVYPKSALNDRRAYGEESVTFRYETDGDAVSASSNEVTAHNSNGYYILLDDNATLSVVTVINGIASDPAGGEYTFSVDAPAFSLVGGTYDGNQQTRLSTNTKTQQNNLSWNTVIYYTTGDTEFAFNATTGEVTSEGWIAYDATNNPYLDILVENSPVTIKAVTLSNYFNGRSEYRASNVTTETYTLTAANLAVTVSPAAGTYFNAQNITLGVKNNVGNYTIYYTTDNSDPASSSTALEYTGTAITVDRDMTIKVYAIDSRSGDGGEAAATAFYKIGIQPVVYSPIPGTIYKGDDEDITVEMFSVTPNARIYYTVAEGVDNWPADPTTSSEEYLAAVPLETGKVYNFKAVAVAGSQVSSVTPGTFTIEGLGSGWPNVDAMNNDTNHSTAKQLDNPVQVVYMSTWRNNGTKPEFCFVRDNSGYGLVYFGGSNVTAYNGYTKFQMGDWLAGGTVKGKLNVWSSSFINELGTSSGSVTAWPSASLGNTAILPEETTNLAITQGWTKNGPYSGSNYAQYIDANKNLFGHYVHMRKNNITNVTGEGGGNEKHIGIITDQSGVPLNYYDGFYLFSGYNNSPDYDQTFFNNIQNNGGTFDIYAIVYFYGPNANNSSYSNAPYEIFPIDFEWIYKPEFNIGSGTYYEPQTISLTCESEGAQIWYKTSGMEDYELYTAPFEVDATTTIETYSTLPSKYNDMMESVVNSIDVQMGTIEAPVISPESQVNAIGATPIDATITCATEGATIYFTIDGSDPKTSTTRYEYTSANIAQYLTGISQTITVRAIAFMEDYYSAEADACTYTFVHNNGVIYDLVTDLSKLIEGNVYMVVNKANNMAMSTTQNTNNRGTTGVQFVDEDTKTQVYGNSEVALFTLEKVGSRWYLKAMNGSGFFCVGDGNTLLTEAEADGNAEATISIDDDSEHQAHISFIYNNETTRYLRYYNSGQAFSTYTNEAVNLPVSLYYSAETTLAQIEKSGTVDNSYTVADKLQVVYIGKMKTANNGEVDVAWARDLVDNIDAVKIPTDKIDYMRNAGQQSGEWQQNNWVMLDLRNITANEFRKLSNNCVIEGGTLVGKYTDNRNYTIEVSGDAVLQIGESIGTYVPNVYCAANYGANKDGIQTGSNDIEYWFMTPKVMEVATHTWSVWNDNPAGFFVPAFNDTDFGHVINGAHLKGGFAADLSTYNLNPFTPAQGQAYEFLGVVMLPEPEGTSTPAGAPRRAGSNSHDVEDTNLNADYKVAALNLTGGQGQIVTGVNQLQAGREVVSVTYCDVAGRMSQKPFEGLNIIVTRYSDGTTVTRKALF